MVQRNKDKDDNRFLIGKNENKTVQQVTKVLKEESIPKIL